MDEPSIHVTGFLSMSMCLEIEVRVMVRDCRCNYRPFQRVLIDLVEDKTESVSPTGLKCPYALTIIDRLTRFAVLVALPDKKEKNIAKALVERIFGIFGPPETLHSNKGARSLKIKL